MHVGVTTLKSKSHGKSEESGFTQELSLKLTELGFSRDTSYNWAKTTEKSLQQNTTADATVVALAGTILTIQQVVGVCDDITFRYQFYRSIFMTTVLRKIDCLKKSVFVKRSSFFGMVVIRNGW